MPSGIINLALGLAIQVGAPGPSETPNAPVPYRAYQAYGFEGSAEQRHPFDSQMNWVHGYHQEIPAYHGYATFRPYNYKDLLSQSQTAAGWGERPSMPYGQQFWHKYQDQAAMLKASRSNATPAPYTYTQQPFSQPGFMPQPTWQQPMPAMSQAPGWTIHQSGLQVPASQITNPQQAGGQNSIAIPATMSDTLQPPPLGELNQLNYRR